MGELLEHPHLRGLALKRVPIVLLGFGKVGQAFASLLAERKGFTEEGVRLELVGIFDRSGGLMGEGLSIPEIVAAKRAGTSVSALPGIFAGHRESTVLGGLSSLAEWPGAILVDASPTDPKTGEPGLSAVRHALERGHSAVLASKGPLVHAFGDLVELAGRETCRIGISAAVGTPLPSLETMHLSLRGAGLRGFRGIFNETSNRILIKMEAGMSYEAAVENARSAGILEPDPSLDLEGWDTAFKVLILARSFWGAEIPLDTVRVKGITEVTAEQLSRIQDAGRKLRLIGSARPRNPGGDVEIGVAPEEIGPDDPFYPLAAGEKGAEFDSDLMGRFVIRSGKGGPLTTAAALVKDILNIAHHPTPFAL